MNPGSIHRLNDIPVKKGPVIYWMSRDQRAGNNRALLYARELSLKNRQPLHTAFCLSPSFLGASGRQCSFMLEGLQELEETLLDLNISFRVLYGNPPEMIAGLARDTEAGAVVTDFSPLRLTTGWKREAVKNLDAAVFEVDAHNIVPCRAASDRQEYAAYTFRPKIKRLLDEYLEESPGLKKHPFGRPAARGTDWKKLREKFPVKEGVPGAGWIIPGEKEAVAAMKKFLRHGLSGYGKSRNDPVLGGQSGLSPYLHFGQLSPGRLALEVKRKGGEDAEAFLEELIVRRELSDNFCFYNRSYDSAGGFPRWAAESHGLHEKDSREYLYKRAEFEAAGTHDELWNAAQTEMVKTGKMHGYMRMYWAKKILEWTESPAEAIKTAVFLNDKYELDGRDPNGYAGIMWAVGGVHDRPWPERPVFGRVRYMNYNGCKSKFNVGKYIAKIRSL